MKNSKLLIFRKASTGSASNAVAMHKISVENVSRTQATFSMCNAAVPNNFLSMSHQDMWEQ